VEPEVYPGFREVTQAVRAFGKRTFLAGK